YSISENFYPLGSCTMKYNPVLNEQAAALPGFAGLHPYQDEETVQGALELMWRLERALCAVVGVERATLQPAAGAHGEWTALRLIAAFHDSGEVNRTEVLVPDSAHGTGPASAALSGVHVAEVKPGPGPVGVNADLVPFLPTPTVERTNGHLELDYKHAQSIGRVRSLYGNFGMLVRAYTYSLAMGGDGLSQASQDAVLSANYLRKL